MGNSRSTDADWVTYSTAAVTKSRADTFYRSSAKDVTRTGEKVDAVEIKLRESRDSAANPNSTPIIIGLDVTGSMGWLAEALAKTELPRLIGMILEKSPIADPHLMFMGIGDAVHPDEQPLQMTQFEADLKIAEQLQGIWLEGKGGGNHFESYDLAWAAAAYKTVSDCWEKRKKKGYLFTLGDEEFPRESSPSYLLRLSGDIPKDEANPEGLLKVAQEKWNVFHLVVAEGDYARRHGAKSVLYDWNKHLGKRALLLENHKFTSEVLVSAIAINEGADPDEVISKLSGPAAEAVRTALFGKESG